VFRAICAVQHCNSLTRYAASVENVLRKRLRNVENTTRSEANNSKSDQKSGDMYEPELQGWAVMHGGSVHIARFSGSGIAPIQ
jgi:hypothetical protein